MEDSGSNPPQDAPVIDNPLHLAHLAHLDTTDRLHDNLFACERGCRKLGRRRCTPGPLAAPRVPKATDGSPPPKPWSGLPVPTGRRPREKVTHGRATDSAS